jgi:hypothetical protein
LENEDDPIHLELTHASLLDNPQFSALSYTWGAPIDGLDPGWDDSTATESIFVDGKEFPVRWNLFDLLWTLGMRIARDDPLLWIDAISINQDDLSERSQQVRLMDKIYKDPRHIVIWLGRRSDDSDLAIKTMIDLAKSWESRSKDMRKPSLHPSMKEEYNTLVERELTGPKSKEQLLALVRLFLRPWWKRAWIVQEFVLPYNAQIICEGAPFADWDDLDFTWRLICQHYQNFSLYREPDRRQLFNIIELLVRSAIHARPLFELRQRFSDRRKFPSLSLPEAFQYLSRSRASDSRDKVYAALGLTPDAHLIEINYAWPVGQVYIHATKTCIEYYKSLHIMNFCSAPENHNVDGLPSWVVDWSDRKYGSRLPICADVYGSEIRGDGTAEPLYSAGGSNDLCFRFDPEKTLVLSGYVIDQIDYASEARAVELIIESEIHGPVDEKRMEELLLANQEFQKQESFSFRQKILNHEWLRDWLGQATGFEQSSTLTPDGPVGDAKESDTTKMQYVPTDEPLTAAFMATLMCDTGIDSTHQRRRLRTFGGSVDNDTIRVSIDRCLYGRKFIASKGHLLGLGPAETQLGDIVCVIPGHQTPMLLRNAEAGMYTFVGECYIHGIMDGEFLDFNENKPREQRQPIREIKIV